MSDPSSPGRFTVHVPAALSVRRRVTVSLAAALLLFAAGCTAEPGLDKVKFSELFQTAQDLKTAFSSGDHCEVPAVVLQKLGSGITTLKDTTSSKAERDLISAFMNLMITSQDALFVCRSRANLSGFGIVPKGRIYVTQELDPIVEKYDLAIERHVYKPTGAYWKSISVDSIRLIWEKAEMQIKSIEVMLTYS